MRSGARGARAPLRTSLERSNPSTSRRKEVFPLNTRRVGPCRILLEGIHGGFLLIKLRSPCTQGRPFCSSRIPQGASLCAPHGLLGVGWSLRRGWFVGVSGCVNAAEISRGPPSGFAPQRCGTSQCGQQVARKSRARAEGQLPSVAAGPVACHSVPCLMVPARHLLLSLPKAELLF